MAKRISGPPRRPRNPIARVVRTPQYRQRVETDRRRKPAPPDRRDLEAALEERPEAVEVGEESDKDEKLRE